MNFKTVLLRKGTMRGKTGVKKSREGGGMETFAKEKR